MDEVENWDLQSPVVKLCFCVDPKHVVTEYKVAIGEQSSVRGSSLNWNLGLPGESLAEEAGR